LNFLTQILAFISGYIIYNLAGGNSGTATAGSIRGICLIAPACFGASILTSSSLESAGLGVTSSSYNLVVDTVSFGTTIGFFFLDCFLYLALTWYISNVLPSEYGTTRPWWFIFDYRFWMRSCSKSSAPAQYNPVHDDHDFAELVKSSETYEPVVDDKVGVDGLRVRKLRKVFPKAAGGADLIAVDSVDLDMFEGEVFALLGHNGAGKTTSNP
jgi:ATP-binding cassette subfamily A (ABC1) protein 3